MGFVNKDSLRSFFEKPRPKAPHDYSIKSFRFSDEKNVRLGKYNGQTIIKKAKTK